MDKAIIGTIVGLLVGIVGLQGPFGWLIGGALGFVLGQVWALSIRIKGLERELTNLQKRPQQELPLQSKMSDTQPIEDISSQAGSTATIVESSYQPAPSWKEQTPQNNASSNDEASTWRLPERLQNVFDQVRNFFTQGNPIVRIGMLVLLFGLSFLAKYASGAGLFPVELRIAAIAMVAAILLMIGWKTRNRHHGYGLILQGGGIATLYLTVFAAGKFYALMPNNLAFGLMLLIVILGAALAVLQSAQVLAVMATTGGFLVPILTSDGTGSHIGLFSFYLALNLGVLLIAWFKTWRVLNWIGFLFTFVITSIWEALSYEPSLYYSTQLFLIFFFALYLTVSLLFSIKQPPKLTGLVDGSLVFGLPIAAFGQQTLLLKHTELGLAISALVLSAIYITLASILWRKYRQTHRLLSESFIALGVVFATLAVPLALDASWTSAAWCIEAAGLVWIGAKQQRYLGRIAGYILYILGIASLLLDSHIELRFSSLASVHFISLLVLALSAFCIGFILNRHSLSLSRYERNLESICIAVGFVWWCITGFKELISHLSEQTFFIANILFLSLSVLGLMSLSKRLHWSRLYYTAYSLLPLTALWVVIFAAFSFIDKNALHPYGGIGSLALLTFAVVQYRFLWQQKEHRGTETDTESQLINSWHFLTAWTLLSTLFWEVYWWQQEMNWHGVNALLLWFFAFTTPLAALIAVLHRPHWPFEQYRGAYKDILPIPLVVLTGLWFIFACTRAGTTEHFYLPILNPLDLAQLAVVVLSSYLFRKNIMQFNRSDRVFAFALSALIGFIWLNVVVLRIVHNYTDVPYELPSLWRSGAVHMALSILWSLCALIVMNFSRRLQNRKLWVFGACLLGTVLIKLFTKDLTDTGNLTRIISFIVVGGLMLLIGYLSPIPRSSSHTELEVKEESS